MFMESNRNFLRAWREHRGLGLDDLAEEAGTTPAVISLLETGDRRLSDKWVRKLAPALGVDPGPLLNHHPDELAEGVVRLSPEPPEG